MLNYEIDDGTYEGHVLHQKRHGYGVFRSKQGDRYEGEWHNDQRHGKGKELNAHGDFYFGRPRCAAPRSNRFRA